MGIGTDMDRIAGNKRYRLGDLVPRRIAVLRALQLGDLLCAVPALQALRAAWPEAEIVLVGLPWARSFVDRFRHCLDGFREFPGWPGLPEQSPQLERIPAFLAAMQAEHFDLALQLHGSGPFVNPLTVLFGARRCAGFYLPGDYCPDPDLFLPWPERGLEVRRLLRLTEFLGLPTPSEELEFPLRLEDFAEAERLVGGLRSGEYVCIHPGASTPARRWPPGHFADVAAALAGRGLRVVLTGTAAEASLTRAVAAALSWWPCLDLAGRTTLGGVAALLAGARLLVCNDTGVSHLAAALCVPSVVVSTDDNPARWAPTDGRLHRVLCRAGGVGPDEVLAAAEDLLAFAPAGASLAGAF
jgi:ADP-heptose:LPS heptosyltransferase